MGSALKEVVKGFRGKHSYRCPFKRKPPKRAILLKVPTELRGSLVVAKRFQYRAASTMRKSLVLRDGREWLWDNEIADAILTLVWEDLQKRYNKSRAHRLNFYSGWKFEFVRI